MARIEKADSYRVKQEKIPFTQHLNCVLQNLKDPVALAIWCYLTSLPPNWKIYRSYLMKHFGIGRDKTNKALKTLSDLHLLVYVQERTSSGEFAESYIEMRAGFEFQEKLSTDKGTATLKHRYTENPLNGETAPIKEIKSLKRKRRAARAREEHATPLPADFFPEENTASLIANEFGYSADECEELLSRFIQFYKKRGDVCADWDARCLAWFRNEKDRPGFLEKRGSGKTSAPKSQEWIVEPPPPRTRESYHAEQEAMQHIYTKIGKPKGIGKINEDHGRVAEGSRRKTG